jgi:hypothetical protein
MMRLSNGITSSVRVFAIEKPMDRLNEPVLSAAYLRVIDLAWHAQFDAR